MTWRFKAVVFINCKKLKYSDHLKCLSYDPVSWSLKVKHWPTDKEHRIVKLYWFQFVIVIELKCFDQPVRSATLSSLKSTIY